MFFECSSDITFSTTILFAAVVAAATNGFSRFTKFIYLINKQLLIFHDLYLRSFLAIVILCYAPNNTLL